MLGKIEGKKRRGQQKVTWLDSITDSMDMNLRKLQETVKDREAWHARVHIVTKSWTWLSFPGSSDGKEAACKAGDWGSISGWRRLPGERNGNPLQYSCLENFMDRGAWWAIVHGVSKSWTWLSDYYLKLSDWTTTTTNVLGGEEFLAKTVPLLTSKENLRIVMHEIKHTWKCFENSKC